MSVSGKPPWPWWNFERRDRRTRPSSSTSCNPDWPVTKFPPTSRSSRPPRGRRPASPIWARSGATLATRCPRRRATMSSESTTVGDVLRAQARSRGDHPLLICDSERISYADADRLSARLARGLIGLGAGKGSHVGLLYPHGVAVVVGMLAAARLGAVVVPFSTFATARELREQLVDSDTEILFAAQSFRSHDYVQQLAGLLPASDLDSGDRLFDVAAPQLRHVIFDLTGLYRLAETVDERLLTAMQNDVDGSDPLTIVYTSGTTTAPKGGAHTHAARLNPQ